MSEPRGMRHVFSTSYAETYVGVAPEGFVRCSAGEAQGVRVEGTCPRCLGGTVSEYRYGTPGTGTKGLLDRLRAVRQAPAPQEQDAALLREVHFCECGHPHPGLPADAPFVGCGASWRLSRLSGGEGNG
ncbi:hypothetical protein ABZ079_11615 [Streptomyces sp. NPDC006314]|uniref:hypothetical protein n=1 Tax=Streptomyces sp. NPDC006314 TaxID=3154475 RepID=UPI0033B78F80